MSKKNRNQNRNRPSTPPGPVKQSAAQTLRQFLDGPPPVPYSDLTHIRICPGNGNENENEHENGNDPASPLPGDAEPADTAAAAGSRANAVRGSFRSKILFNREMFESIELTSQNFIKDVKPVGELEHYLVREMARSSTQDEKCSEQMLIDDLRTVELVGSSWDMANSSRVEKLGSKLSESPKVVAGALSRCKHGALYLVDKWSAIDESIATNGCLDEEQRQVCYDLLGIDHVFRNGSRQVPAGSDTQGLKALVTRQLAYHRGNLARTLNATDLAAKKMAALGIVSERDPASKLLRADQNRARRRFSWAMSTLFLLRSGADASTIIDPESGKPLAAGPRPTAVRQPAKHAAVPPAPPEAAPPPPESPPSPALPPLPEGLSTEDKEMFLVAAGAIVGKTAASPAAAPWLTPTA